ncbi:helix-turn-helix domain-containing protein [Pedobacter sp. SYP-B3415]|uniref:helix-turn-helix domain-containing protein n=1 Tax=Pedobacter sp. SYP-B3415 TaxID=2496641 RepID=UPI00101C0ADF|nr:AraC family transcriptional regulator [Pedobacter sp. SYP-B3415]
MKFQKTLRNQNLIRIETAHEAVQQQDHVAYTLNVVLNGTALYRFGKRKAQLYPDSCLMLSPGIKSEVTISADFDVEILTISFSTSFINSFLKQTGIAAEQMTKGGFGESLYPISDDMRITIGHLRRHLERGTDNEELINEYLYHCLQNYFTVFSREVVLRMEKLRFSKATTREEVMKRLNDAREYISSNYNKNISLQDAADIACLSVNHFMRTFKEAYGFSPHQYLIRLRLKRARYLLRNTPYALHEIVGMVGFECPSSFIRLFRNNFTMTPLKYRAAGTPMPA